MGWKAHAISVKIAAGGNIAGNTSYYVRRHGGMRLRPKLVLTLVEQ